MRKADANEQGNFATNIATNMGIRNQTSKGRGREGRASTRRNTAGAAVGVEAAEVDETVWAPPTGAYLTDETGLFRVANAFSSSDELFLEFENCMTLGLVLCPARTVAKLGLRIVTPASFNL